jgi:hypothetical protein
VAFLLWLGILMALGVIFYFLVLDVKSFFCGVSYCYDVCLEYVNYGTKSFTIYEGHLEMGTKVKFFIFFGFSFRVDDFALMVEIICKV